MRTNVIACSAFVLAFCIPQTADANIYRGALRDSGNRWVFNVVTDGTLGPLSLQNIESITVHLPAPTYVDYPGYYASFRTLQHNSPGPGRQFAFLQVVGNALVATEDQLYFDFTTPGPNAFNLIGAGTGKGPPDYAYVCLQTNDACSYTFFTTFPTMQAASTGWGEYVGFEREGVGQVTLGRRAAQSLVPEPSTWVMLISGFGLVGAVSRRQRRIRQTV